MTADPIRRTNLAINDDEGRTETVWATDEGQGRFRLDNIPFLVYGLSLNDVVSAQRVDGQLTLDRVIERSGHSTYRLALRDGIDPTDFPRLTEGLVTLGCGLERFTPRTIGVDVPPTVDIYAAYAAIAEGMASGLWLFDEVNVEHALK